MCNIIIRFTKFLGDKMAAKYISEIFAEINETPEKFEQYKNDTTIVQLLLRNFVDEFKFDLPEGTPPYKENDSPIGMAESNFRREARRLYIFRDPRINQIKRETLFISMLESFDKDDAEILILIKDQSLTNKYPNITRELVKSVLPTN